MQTTTTKDTRPIHTVSLPPFESVSCSRCGGSGNYSFCTMYGSRCFKCAGKKRTLTKRGAAANAMYIATMSRRASDLKPGDVVFEDCFGTRWATVIAVGAVDGRFDVETKTCKHGVTADTLFRLRGTYAERVAAWMAAYAYQQTLTKTGTPRKRIAA